MPNEYVILTVEETGPVLGGQGVRAERAKTLGMETRTLDSGELAEVGRQPNVLSAATSMPVTLVRPLAASAEAADSSGGEATWGLEAVGALTTQRTGAGVTVAILDTGINADHEAFRGKEIEQKDFTGEGIGDQHGHGTHCAGTVFGAPVGGKRIGVAPGIEKALIGKVLDRHGGGSTESILQGVLWAAQAGANVISMSLGLDFPGMVARLIAQGRDTQEATSLGLQAYRQNVRLFDKMAEFVQARSAMFSKTLVIAAAGNESKRPEITIAVAPPAAADGIIAVAALGRTNGSLADLTVASFSNSGAAVSAPGVDIESAAHDSSDGLKALSGTSMATPHVAGIAALWMEELAANDPAFRVDEVEANLKARARKDVFAADVAAGDRNAGLVQAPQP